MQRYFTSDYSNNVFTLSMEDTYHITKVMRYKLGEKIEIVYDAKTYISEIIGLTPVVTAKILEETLEDSEKNSVVVEEVSDTIFAINEKAKQLNE